MDFVERNPDANRISLVSLFPPALSENDGTLSPSY